MEYHKINSIYKRDEKTKEFTNEFSLPEFEYLKHNLWEFTEKIDGTNVRIIWENGELRGWDLEWIDVVCNSEGYDSIPYREFYLEKIGLKGGDKK